MKSSIDQLNSFLRGELSAVETYQMALDKLDKTSAARTEIQACMKSHQDRVAVLRDAIVKLGGTPATGSGPWGVFAKVVEGSARLLGDKTAVAALEEGEDHGLKDYKTDIDKLDAESRRVVSTQLLPLQQHTHNVMSALKHRLT
jgi:demethoxyubiquinone hydroxylase (CLK1/Coq7/Cat5 family)